MQNNRYFYPGSSCDLDIKLCAQGFKRLLAGADVWVNPDKLEIVSISSLGETAKTRYDDIDSYRASVRGINEYFKIFGEGGINGPKQIGS